MLNKGWALIRISTNRNELSPFSPSLTSQIEFLPLDYNRFAFDVNYFGPLAVTKAFLPLLRESKGRIVNVSR